MELVLKRKSLWHLTISPAVWLVHFTLTYVGASVWCAKLGREADLGKVRIFIAFITVFCLMPVIYQMIKGYRQHQTGLSDLPHDDDTPEDRERFLGISNFLISSLSALAILFIGFNAVIFRSCQ